MQNDKVQQRKSIAITPLIVEVTGGTDGIRDIRLLDSALESIYATFDGKELYPTKEEKAAKLGYGLVSNHAFIDGNKRIGIYVMLMFLEVNGIPIDVPNKEIVRVGLALADGSMKYKELLEWIRANE